jgi:Flp pilus assembly protein TadD
MAIDINPKEGMFWSNKGKILELLGRTDEANESLNTARELGYTVSS